MNLRTVAYFCIAVLLVVLGVHAVSAMRRPFGISHDGVNGAVWGWGSRALREDGIAWSRMGTRRRQPNGVWTYANHPPLLVVEAAAAEEVLGEHPWSTRLPAIAATGIAIVATVTLLRTVGVGVGAAVTGAALGFGVPMVGVYGTMLDTPVVGLAPAVILLLLDARARRGLRSPPALVAITAAACVLSSWEGLLLTAVVAAAALVRLVRRKALGHDVALVAGAITGAILVAGWLWWAYGSVAPLAGQVGARSGVGTRPTSLASVVYAVRDYGRELLPVWVAAAAVPALIAGCWDRRTRWVTTVSLATVTAWVFGFREGAVIHDYWAYWVVLPLALGLGAGLDLLLSTYIRSQWTTFSAGVAVAAVALGALGLTMTVPAGESQVVGAKAARVLLATRFSPTQRTLWFGGAQRASLDWATYDTRRRSIALPGVDALRALGRNRPTDLVFIAPGAPAAGHPCSSKIRRGAPFALLPAADVAGALDGDVVRPC